MRGAEPPDEHVGGGVVAQDDHQVDQIGDRQREAVVNPLQDA